jgi:hypothetical protein
MLGYIQPAGSRSTLVLLANSLEESEGADYRLLGQPILPSLRLIGGGREFAGSINIEGRPAWMTRQPVPGCGLRLGSELLDTRPATRRGASEPPQLSTKFILVATAPGRFTPSVVNPRALQLPATSQL